MGQRRGTVAVALGTVLLLDVLRVWLPSIITIFGQAASTPVEQLAAFGLAWFLAGLLAPVAAWLVGPVRLAVAAAVVLVAARVALPLTGGAGPQLYVACAGVVAGLAWLCGTAMAGGSPLAGLAGIGLAAALHAALSTVDLTWRSGPGAWLLLGAEAAAFLAAQVAAARSTPAARADDQYTGRPADRAGATAPATGSRGWFLFGPAALLAGMWAASPALAGAAVSHWSGRLAGHPGVAETPGAGGTAATVGLTAASVLALAAGAAFVHRRVPGRASVVTAGVVLVAGAAVFGVNWTAAMPAAMVLGAAALGACVAATAAAAPTKAARAGFAAVAGMIVFAVAAVAFYAAYDAGYPNWWVPPAVALPVAILAARARPARRREQPAERRTGERPAGRAVGRRPPVAVPVALLVLALAATGAWWAPPGERPPAPGTGDLRLVAYNIRMGFGLAGRFDPDALAGVVAAQRPDVVVLGEVDRAWLLNGGHDTLEALARRLGLRYLFGPAADQVWGDAVLTRLPVLDAESVRLPADGAPTGAQALGVRLDAGAGRRFVVVSTHLQPPPGRPPLAQARALTRFAERFRRGDPAVLAGDFNVRPGSETFDLLLRAGYADALAAARPLLTSPADAPREEIDHVLATPGLTGSDAVAPRTTDSDHLPVAVTLHLTP